jgi:PadR family transcriptional regulator PadR
MGRQPNNLSIPAISVLTAISRGSRYGFELMDKTGLASGTVYPILGRLAENGLVASRWERYETARNAKRPARKYYETTTLGEEKLLEAVAHYQTLGGLITPPEPVADHG